MMSIFPVTRSLSMNKPTWNIFMHITEITNTLGRINFILQFYIIGFIRIKICTHCYVLILPTLTKLMQLMKLVGCHCFSCRFSVVEHIKLNVGHFKYTFTIAWCLCICAHPFTWRIVWRKHKNIMCMKNAGLSATLTQSHSRIIFNKWLIYRREHINLVSFDYIHKFYTYCLVHLIYLNPIYFQQCSPWNTIVNKEIQTILRMH